MNDSLSPSELIEVFLDGEASAGERRALFDALGSDAALRAEFQDALATRCSLAAEARTLVPSAALAAAVFAAVGTVDANAAPVAAQTASVVSRGGMGIVARRALGILAATVIVGETAYIATHREAAMTSTPTVAQSAAPSAAASQTPMATSAEPAPAATARAAHVATLRRPRVQAAPVEMKEQVVDANTRATNIVDGNDRATDVVEQIPAVAVPLADDGRAGETLADRPAPQRSMQEATAIDMPVVPDSRFAVRLRGMWGFVPTPDRRLDDPDHTKVNDLAIDVRYQLSSEHAVGLAYGRETLPVVLTRDVDDRAFRPSVSWGGAMYQWTPSSLNIMPRLNPFVMAIAGASTTGPMLRAALGAEWRPDARTTFTLAVEGVEASYQENSAWRGVQKFSVTYGVGLRF